MIAQEAGGFLSVPKIQNSLCTPVSTMYSETVGVAVKELKLGYYNYETLSTTHPNHCVA